LAWQNFYQYCKVGCSIDVKFIDSLNEAGAVLPSSNKDAAGIFLRIKKFNYSRKH
jgi:hypothetical protein